MTDCTHATRTQKTFCVSHEQPLVPDKFFDFAIGIGDFRPERGIHVSSLDPFWDGMRPVAYGAAGNYVVPRAIGLETPAPDITGIFSHRKIVVRNLVGRSATYYPTLRELSAAECMEVSVEEVQPRHGSEFLITTPLRFPQGIVRQYAEVHNAADLFEYLTIAVQIGVMTPAEVQEFARETIFIPGGCELGIYPTTWLIQSLNRIEALGREFVTRCGTRIRTYDPYQIRAVGFLAERLGSYFLLKELRDKYPDGVSCDVFGHMCVILPEGEQYKGGVAG